jgi:hypothetical protein
LREAGHNVVVRVGSKDLTLEEFDQGVGYGSSHRHIAQSTYYNKQAELRRLERSLDAMSPDSPERYEIGKRVAQIKTLLGLSDQSNVSADALKKSDNALKSLVHALTSNVDLSDEQLERTPVQTAANWAQTNNRLWLRWKLNRSRRNLREFNAELTLQPDNLDLRSKINQEQETFEILVQQLAELTKTEATK